MSDTLPNVMTHAAVCRACDMAAPAEISRLAGTLRLEPKKSSTGHMCWSPEDSEQIIDAYWKRRQAQTAVRLKGLTYEQAERGGFSPIVKTRSRRWT